MSPHLALVLLLLSARTEAYDMIPRWGHAAVYIPSPPTVFIHGGKTSSGGGSQSYSASSNSPDLIRLPLSQSFDASSPPYELVDASSAPAYAFHSLSRLPDNRLLIFGGDGGTNTPLPAGTDSAWISNNSTYAFTQQSSTWASQPPRMIYHSSATGADGTVYIAGGLRNDGSGRILSDVYAFDPTNERFSPLPTLPQGLAHHSLIIARNGTLVTFGGIHTSPGTGNPALTPMDTLYALDAGATTWRTISTSGTAPETRRGHAALLDGDDVLLFGGSDLSLASSRGDVWRLKLGTASWSAVEIAANSFTPRFDFTATPVGGGQILIFGGYGSNGPVSPGTLIFDSSSSKTVTTFDSQRSGSTSTSGPNQPGQSSGALPSRPVNPTAPPQGSSGVLEPGSGSQVGGGGGVSGTPTDKPDDPNTDPSGSGGSSGLSTGEQIGIAMGSVAGISLFALLLFFCIRRRQRQHRHAPVYDPYAANDNGARGMQSQWSEKSGIVGLGLGAVSAGWTRISPKREPYHSLQDEVLYSPPAPNRKSTRRVGNGIRLVGPRGARGPSQSQSQSQAYSYANLPPGVRSPPRVDMLSDEDSRSFQVPVPVPEKDWTVDRRTRGDWMPATNMRLSETDTYTSEEEREGLLVPPIRIAGGPVPTPLGSATIFDLDPFSDNSDARSMRSVRSVDSAISNGPGLHQLPSNAPMDFSDLLAVPKRYAFYDSTNNRSDLSRSTNASHSQTHSDAEEGTVHRASLLHPRVASIVSPDPDEGLPVKRSASFFQRMTAGGITGLLGGSGSSGGGRGRKVSLRELYDIDIRDDRPEPKLWPVESRQGTASHGTEGSGSTSGESPSDSRPPSAWMIARHGKGPSVSSVSSAKSMRDMVVVQRDTTEGSSGDVGTMDMDAEVEAEADADITVEDDPDLLLPIAPPFAAKRIVTPPPIPVPEAPRRAPTTVPPKTPAKIPSVTNHIREDEPTTPTPKATIKRVQPSISVTSFASPSTSDTSTSAANSNTTPNRSTRASSPPHGSPLAKTILSHRRPVKDMVFSINKRSSQQFASDFDVMSLSPGRVASGPSHPSPSSSAAGSGPGAGAGPSGNGSPALRPISWSPASQYSTTTSASSPSSIPQIGSSSRGKMEVPGNRRLRGEVKKTKWEVRRRESLVIANPDRK